MKRLFPILLVLVGCSDGLFGPDAAKSIDIEIEAAGVSEATVLVGEDPASQVYVRSKGKATVAAGLESFEHRLADTTSEAELLALREDLWDDAESQRQYELEHGARQAGNIRFGGSGGVFLDDGLYGLGMGVRGGGLGFARHVVVNLGK